MKCDEVKCMFCPNLDGVLKQISGGKDQKDAMWAHILCVNWIPEVNFIDDQNEKITGTMPQDRFKLTCNVCKKSKVGACI